MTYTIGFALLDHSPQGIERTSTLGQHCTSIGQAQQGRDLWVTGYALAATLQVIGMTDIPYLEYPYHPPSWTVEARDCLLEKPITIDEEGYVKVPQGPGIGVEIKEENVQKYLKRKSINPTRS
jgi:L-alanine-DL-glutamate epimerase-like enolase superfamily enzyme